MTIKTTTAAARCVARIYDNGGKTADRYTVILRDGSVFAMGADATSPRGFNQYAGQVSEFSHGLSHTGRKISFQALTVSAKRAVQDRCRNVQPAARRRGR